MFENIALCLAILALSYPMKGCEDGLSGLMTALKSEGECSASFTILPLPHMMLACCDHTEGTKMLKLSS